VLDYIPTYTIILVIVYKHKGNVLLECEDSAVIFTNQVLWIDSWRYKPTPIISDCYKVDVSILQRFVL
jgi:hypothetical protein